MLIIWLLLGCASTGSIGGCEYRDERVGADEIGPQGVSASGMMAMIGTRTFEVEADESYGPEWSEPLLTHGPFTLAAEPTDERSFVRTWQPGGECFLLEDEVSHLYATVEARLTSADGAFDVSGEYYISSLGSGEEGVHWAWDGDHLGLVGQVPAWVEAATAAEQESHCPDAGEDATTWVMPSDSITAPGVSIEARYRKHGVCNYAALVAIADLVPTDQ